MMRLFRFDPKVAHPITKFDSRNVAIGRGVRMIDSPMAQVSCFHFDPDSVVGFHQATIPQLMMVVAGEGWVRGEEAARTHMLPGRAAFWEAGEWHESGSDTGMTAIVVEGDRLDPTVYMVELSDDG